MRLYILKNLIYYKLKLDWKLKIIAIQSNRNIRTDLKSKY